MLDEYEAMLALLAFMNAPTKRELAARRAAIDRASKKSLQATRNSLKQKLTELRRDVGATRALGYYATMLKRIKDIQGRVVTIPAYVGLALFSKYPRVVEAVKNDELPAHAHIELDIQGRYEPQDRLQLHILEAMLFEDMCRFWNDSCEIIIDPERPHAMKAEIKRRSALYRAAVSSAFYMVEAYCNGIAFEVFATRKDELSDRELEMVTERDIKHSRPKYLTIRDKILHYPRLLARAAAPLLQENNCPDLAFFLSNAKQFRDAIVHASPALTPDTLQPEKGRLFVGLDHEQCARVVDSAISVVQKIASAIERPKSIFWIQPRQSDGRFDPSVFD